MEQTMAARKTAVLSLLLILYKLLVGRTGTSWDNLVGTDPSSQQSICVSASVPCDHSYEL
eukprot:3275940-Amphidinium_carterae.1